MAKQIQHEEAETSSKCFYEKNHAGQKNYRTSELLSATVPLMEKIQSKLGLSDETVNVKEAFAKVFNMAGISVTVDDFDRNMAIITPKATVEAVADTSNSILNSYIKQLTEILTKAQAEKKEIKEDALKSVIVDKLKVPQPLCKAVYEATKSFCEVPKVETKDWF